MISYENVENDDGEDDEEWCQEKPLSRVLSAASASRAFHRFSLPPVNRHGRIRPHHGILRRW